MYKSKPWTLEEEEEKLVKKKTRSRIKNQKGSKELKKKENIRKVKKGKPVTFNLFGWKIIIKT